MTQTTAETTVARVKVLSNAVLTSLPTSLPTTLSVMDLARRMAREREEMMRRGQ